jgi:hypothetical protein
MVVEAQEILELETDKVNQVLGLFGYEVGAVQVSPHSMNSNE